MSPTKAIAHELTSHQPHLFRSVLMAEDDAEKRSNAEVFRFSDGHVNAVEGETDPSSELHQQIKFILQDCETGKFMRCDSIWSDDMDEALDFLSARRAVFFGMKELTAEFQILQIGCSGLRSTATLKRGFLKWKHATQTARDIGGVGPKSKPYRPFHVPRQNSDLDGAFSENHKTPCGMPCQIRSKQMAFLLRLIGSPSLSNRVVW